LSATLEAPQVAATALPRLWRGIFWVEVPITLGSVAYWLAAPDTFLEQLLGAGDHSAAHGLLYMYAGVVASLVGWLYVRFLLQPDLHLPSFRLFQEALLLGDVWIVAHVLVTLPSAGPPLQTAIAASSMAGFWGLVRAIYLYAPPRRR